MIQLVYDPKQVIVHFCEQFYLLGWVFGTGGGVSIKADGKVFIAPSGYAKEHLTEDMVFEFDDEGSCLLDPGVGLKPSECTPIFQQIYNMTDAGAVIHMHSHNLVMASMLFGDQFTISHQEMIKGFPGKKYSDTLAVPIIENTEHEHQLTDRVGTAITNGAEQAIIVRRHGAYVWGKTAMEAKKHAECLDFLAGIAIDMLQFRLDPVKSA